MVALLFNIILLIRRSKVKDLQLNNIIGRLMSCVETVSEGASLIKKFI